jgi:outer membrane protein TolC
MMTSTGSLRHPDFQLPRCLGLVIGMCLLMFSASAYSESDTGTSSAPGRLTLEYAIQQGTSTTHPSMLAAAANEQVADAERATADSNYDLESEVQLIAGYVDPNDTALNQSNDDNSAAFRARKVLYDFGVTGDRVDSADNLISASQIEYELARQRQVIAIADHYFDVLLADLKYTWDNEAMAMQYVKYDRTLERHALKDASDVELLQRESDYQIARTRRYASETMQRTSRALLAVAMNRPGELATHLNKPDLDVYTRELADLSELVNRAVQRNLTLQALRKRERAAKLALDADSQRFRPTLDASFEAYDYSRDTPSKDDMRARLNLTIPLNENGAQRSEIARKRAEWLQASSEVLQYESRLRNDLAAIWLEMQRLRAEQQELEVTAARVEIELDKARGEYELEIRSDLGDAMVNTSRVNYQQAKNRYQLALAWMQLNLLTGDDPLDIILSANTRGGEAQ